MEKKKNILSLVSYKILPADTGGQRGIAFFNDYLAQVSNLVCVSVKSNNDTLARHYKMHKILSDSPLRYINLFYFFSISKLIKEEKTEWLILEHPYYGWLGWMLKRFLHVKLAVHTHNIEHERFRSVGKKWWQMLRLYERWVLNIADQVFCISEEDRQFMVNKLKIEESKCLLVPYGIMQDASPKNKAEVKASVCRELGLDPDTYLFFFNGALQYKPNTDALEVILNDINPLLLGHSLKYKIIIAGKNLPDRFDQLNNWKNKQVIFLGFVSDIDRYTIAADILLNAVTTGGGIKTKVVEALGHGTTVVSTVSGAAGIDTRITNQKLLLVDDYDWKAFAEQVLQATALAQEPTPAAFYNVFYWGHITGNVIQKLS